MNKRLKTINLKGNDYAQVAERIRLFREDCPRGSIQTTYEISEGVVVFTTIVVKDNKDKNSARADGHSYGKLSGDKVFEKLETISVGRALAKLGYLASGEVASFEEMEEYYEYKEEKKNKAIEALKSAKTVKDLKKVFLSLDDLMADQEVFDTKEEMKKKLEYENEGDK